MERIQSFDILRGIAVLQMIFWQIFDFFSKDDIYSAKFPLSVNIFNMPINGIGLAIFAFISGVSLYLSINNKLKNKANAWDIFKHSLKRYGGYILLSLLFTSLVFGFSVFYKWDEAIQGIGAAALVAAILIIFFRSKWLFAALGLIIMFVQPALRKLADLPSISQNFPLLPSSFNLFQNFVSILLNICIRGFFALVHVLPFILLGVFVSMLFQEMKKKDFIFFSLFAGLLTIAISLILHFSIMKIDIYGRSPSYILGFSGFSLLLLGCIDLIMQKIQKNPVADFLTVFGKAAIFAYVFHFLVIFKILQLLKLESTFDSPISYLFTFISVAVIYYLSKLWIAHKKAIFSWINPHKH